MSGANSEAAPESLRDNAVYRKYRHLVTRLLDRQIRNACLVKDPSAKNGEYATYKGTFHTVNVYQDRVFVWNFDKESVEFDSSEYSRSAKGDSMEVDSSEESSSEGYSSGEDDDEWSDDEE